MAATGRRKRGPLLASLALVTGVSLLAAPATAAVTARAGRAPRASAASGEASVACAGSLDKLYHDTLGPAFRRATGYAFGGPECAGSLALAKEILADEISPGVFLSIGAKALKELFPAKRAKFAMAVAADPLVIGYSRHSRYYSQLNAIRTGKKPLSYLFTLFTTPGFTLGRTDPTQDPQGIFFILFAKLAAKVLHLAAGEADRALGITATSPYGSSRQIFDETALPEEIATGGVDAGSEYLPEARQYGLDYISLPPTLDFAAPKEVHLYSSVSLDVAGSVQQGEVIYLNVGLVSRAKGTTVAPADEAADQAFAAFLLGSKGRSILSKVGYALAPPVVHLAPGETAKTALPGSLYRLYRALGGTVSTS